MKIVVVHSRYRSATPSGENRVVDQEFAALAELGHDVQLFQRRSDDIAGWSAARKAALPAAVVWNGQIRRELRELLRTTRPDVVHIHNTFPLLSASVLYACRDAAVPVVVTLHNYLLACASGGFFRDGQLCHECIEGSPTRAIQHGCYRGSRAATAPVALAAMAHRRAWQTMVSAYSCVSASQRELLRSVLPDDRVFIRHNMIPELSVRQTARRADIVHAGRLEVAKGTPVLMAGWDRYLAGRANPGLRLVIAGSGALEDSVRTWAASRPSVEFVGQLEPDACAELMAAARAVVLPSICQETFGLALIEAMAQGVAPMAAARGAFPELITHGLNGLLFEPDDPAALAAALALAEAEDKTFEEYGAQARKTYEQRFNPADSMQELLEIYRFAVANPALQLSRQNAAVTEREGAFMGEGTSRAELHGKRPAGGEAKYYKKEFWSTENLKYQKPHFRMEKVARLIGRIARDRECDLLDVGCGPAALGRLMPSNVHYYGIDISIPEPAPNLLEADILQAPIGFRDMRFDLVVAQGLFEYLGEHQSQKLAEMAAVLKDDGKLIVTYQNFGHRQRQIYWPYSNVQNPTDFRRDLTRFFRVERWFAGAHNWTHAHPGRPLVRAPQTHLNVYVPIISPKLAIDYIYICSPIGSRRSSGAHGIRLRVVRIALSWRPSADPARPLA